MFVHLCRNVNYRTAGVRPYATKLTNAGVLGNFHLSDFRPLCFTHVPNAATQYARKYAKLLSKNEFSRPSSLATSARLEQLKLSTLGWDLHV